MPRPALSADTSEAAYEADLVLWAEGQARPLREARLGEPDLANLIDEDEEVGDAQRDAIESRLTVPLAHLLMWRFRPGARSASRRATIHEQRGQIARTIRKSPSLRASPAEVLAECHRSGCLLASKETGIVFPASPPSTVAQALDPDFFPKHPDLDHPPTSGAQP